MEKNNTRKYKFFNDILDIKNNIIFKNTESYHEVIIENKIQKFRLDIDINLNENPDYNIEYENEFLHSILDNINLTLNNYNKNLSKNDISLYSSNADYKRSYHIILNKYCFIDHYQIKMFYKLFIDNFSNSKFINYIKFIDHSIYDKNQNFRLLGSYKYGTNRKKICVKEFNWNNNIIKPDNDILSNLKKSLITFIEDSIFLIKKENVNHNITYSEINKKTYDKMIELFKKQNDANCFEIKDIYNNSIKLKRIIPSYCEICLRTHETDNPCLLLINNNVYIWCRRSNIKEKKYLGSIEQSILDKLEYSNEYKNFNKKIDKNDDNYPLFNMGKLGKRIKKNNKFIVIKSTKKRNKINYVQPEIKFGNIQVIKK